MSDGGSFQSKMAILVRSIPPLTQDLLTLGSRPMFGTVLVQSEMEKRRFPLVKIPPLTRRGFSRNKDLSSDAGVPLLFVGAMSPTRLSLSMVASLQSPLLFHLARSL